MYQKMLAPLDGSELSECSLEHVRAVATGCQIPEVVLLRVAEPISSQTYAAYAGVGGDWITKLDRQNQAEAENYLSQLSANLSKEGIAAQTAIVSGRPDEKILDYATENQVDLIIMSTHGRSGVSRWTFGSITDSVLRHSAVPVLISSPPECRSQIVA